MPVGHVEAGMRSFDRAMPEELNRVLTDHASDLLLCSTETAMATCAREGVRGEVAPRGRRDGGRALRFAPLAEERSTVLDELGVEPGELPRWSPRTAPATSTSRAPARLVDAARGPARAGGLPAHPRTRARLEAAGLLDRLDGVEVVPPLGYLDFLELPATPARC